MANRVLIGNRSSGGYGIYVSKSGSDVLSCDVDDLIFSSLDSTSTPFAANGVLQTVPFSGGSGGTEPTVKNDFDYNDTTGHEIGFQDLGDNNFAYVGNAQPSSRPTSQVKYGAVFTSTDADSTILTNHDSSFEGTMVIFKRLSSSSLY